MKPVRARHPFGFTLLEVMIAVTILSFISIFTANMISQGIRAKRKIQSEIDRKSALQSAVNLMSQDIRKAFNYRDINTEVFNAAQKERLKKRQAPVPPATTAPPLTEEEQLEYKIKDVRIVSQFIGETDTLNFTSMNNFRSAKNLQVSDQMEVGYYLESCTSRIKKDITSECLWRRTSPYIDDEIKEGGKKMVVLENVKSLQFRYLGEGHKEEWAETWRSKDGEEITKNKFPAAVEISLVVQDIQFNPPRDLSMTVVAPLRTSNPEDPPVPP